MGTRLAVPVTFTISSGRQPRTPAMSRPTRLASRGRPRGPGPRLWFKHARRDGDRPPGGDIQRRRVRVSCEQIALQGGDVQVGTVATALATAYGDCERCRGLRWRACRLLGCRLGWRIDFARLSTTNGAGVATPFARGHSAGTQMGQRRWWAVRLAVYLLPPHRLARRATREDVARSAVRHGWAARDCRRPFASKINSGRVSGVSSRSQ